MDSSNVKEAYDKLTDAEKEQYSYDEFEKIYHRVLSLESEIKNEKSMVVKRKI